MNKQIEREKIFLFGASGHAKVVTDIIERQGVYQIAFLVDDDPELKGTEIYGYQILGGKAELLSHREEVSGGIVAIGSNPARIKVAAWLEENDFSFVTAVHPSAQLGRGVRIGAGTVVMAGAVINSDTVIGSNAIINTRASIDHDCSIGDGVHIAPGATLCGTIKVGDGSFICAGTTVIPNLSIGQHVIVGAGSTVIRDVPGSVKVLGSPAKFFCFERGLVMKVNKSATEGGAPIRTRSMAPWPYYAQDEIDPVAAVLASGKVNYWTGTEGREFEKEFAAFTGCKRAIALANGTAALELALFAIGIGKGDEVIVTPRTFIASASCCVVSGAIPVMADVDRVSQNISADTIRPLITPKTKAIICVHLAGWPCDMDPILELAREHGIKVIEDCAQAHGATYKGRPVGSIGDVAAFSFCQDKIITTGGEGGMLTTNDEDLWRKAWEYKDHGKCYDAVYNRPHPSGFRWLHDSFGTNRRLTEMQSVIGRVQLTKLPEWTRIRQRHAELLMLGLAAVPALRVPVPPVEIGHAFYKFYAFVETELLNDGWDRDRIMNAVVAEGIPCFSGSCSEIYLEKAFDGLRPAERLPVAKELGETSLMFLVHPTLNERDMLDTVAALKKVMAEAARIEPDQFASQVTAISAAHTGRH